MQSKLRREREIQRDYVASLYDDFSKVRAIAEKHLYENSNVLAIWLFGSRARGNATIGRSGWDLAVITEEERSASQSERDLKGISLRDVENDIRCFDIPVTLFHAKRTSVPHRACLVAAEGIPLAESTWHLQLLELHEHLHMDYEAYRIYLTMIKGALMDIGQVYEGLADIDSSGGWYAKSKAFVSDSQALAEGFIKCGFIWREVYVSWSHQHSELADAAQAADIERSFVEMLRRLEGAPVKDQGTKYEEINEQQIRDTGKRIELLTNAIPSEFVAAWNRSIAINNDDLTDRLFRDVSDCTPILTRYARGIRNSRLPEGFAKAHVGTNDDRAVVSNVWQQRERLADCFELSARLLRAEFGL